MNVHPVQLGWFVLAAVGELAGCYAVWAWVRLGRPPMETDSVVNCYLPTPQSMPCECSFGREPPANSWRYLPESG